MTMGTRRDVLLGGLAVAMSGGRAAMSGQSPRFRVALAGDYEKQALNLAPWRKLGSDAEVVSFDKPFRSMQETIEALRDFDAVTLMRERTPLPREVIEQLPRLKLIVFSGLFNDYLDYVAANERHIIVCRALGMRDESSDKGGISPAELALALMMACAWHIPAADTLIRRGGWAFQPGIPMRGKTLGIVGYGNIGRPVGQSGLALGMQVLGFSRSLTDQAARAEGVTRSDLEPLLRTADVISVHLPLTRQTRGMIGARELEWLKPGMIFINTARAAIIDEEPFIKALRARRIGMAGLDVFWQEPLSASDPLCQLPNVVMTPHIGYVTQESLASRYKALFDVVAAFRQGKIIGQYTPGPR